MIRGRRLTRKESASVFPLKRKKFVPDLVVSKVVDSKADKAVADDLCLRKDVAASKVEIALVVSKEARVAVEDLHLVRHLRVGKKSRSTKKKFNVKYRKHKPSFQVAVVVKARM